MHTLDFQTLHLYEPTSSGITIPVELSVGRERVTISNAKLDTGSSFCYACSLQRSRFLSCGLPCDRTSVEAAVVSAPSHESSTGSF